MPKALVTGGAGFIGSHLVDGLLARGWTVVALDDLSTGRLANIQHLADQPAFSLVEGSILDAGLVARTVAGCSVVYHLAAVVGVKHVVRDPLHQILVNCQGTEQVLVAAERVQAKVVVASSSEVYGKSSQVPFREDSDRLLGSTRVARWAYSACKALDEHLALAYHARGLPTTAVRYFNSYGPRLHPNGYGSVIAKFVGQALAGRPLTVYGDGRQSRCFTDVADTVRGTILAGELAAASGEIFNIGSDRETTIGDLAKLLRALTGSRSEIVFQPPEREYGEGFEDVPRRVPDPSKALRRLGFRAEVELEAGLARTIAWMERELACKQG